MAKIRGFAVTEEGAATVASLVCNMPAHETNDLLLVFAGKDGTPVVNLPAGWTNIQTGASVGAAYRAFYKIAASNAEILTVTTPTAENWVVVVVAVREVDTVSPIIVSAQSGADDAAMPFTGPAGATTAPDNGNLIFHSWYTDSGLSPTAYPPFTNIYCGDNASNSVGVAYTHQETGAAVAAANWFGRANDDGRGVVFAVRSSVSPTLRDAYSDPVESVATMVRALVGGATTEADSWPTATILQIGNDFDSVQRDAGGVFTDVTAAMNNATAADVTFTTAVNNAMYFGHATQFRWISHVLSTVGVGGTLVWEYWNGSAWTTLTLAATNNLTATPVTSRFTPPSNWATTTVNSVANLFWVRARISVTYTTAPVFTQSRRNGMAIANDAVAAQGDAGTNPYTDAALLTPAQSATGLGGSEFLMGAAQDLDTGILLMTSRAALPRDAAIDLASPSENPLGAGMIVSLFDVNTNYLSYGVTSRGALDYDIDGRNVHAIDWNGAATALATRGVVNKSAVTRMHFMLHPIGGQCDIGFSMLVLVTKMCIAGGTSANPLTFGEYFTALNRSCGFFPFGQIAGNAVTVWCPLQIGGGDPIRMAFNLNTIQFPRRYDGSQYFSWNAGDNVAGIIFEGKSGDVIRFTNCVFTSPSKYRWEFDAAASASATYDFTGTTVVNATVTLRSVYTFNSMSFIDCTTFTQNGASITNSTLQNCTITSNNPAALSDNAFISGGTGHAIVITVPGTYTFDGNTFSGYGADGTTDAAIHNNSGGAVTLNIVGGGGTPTVRNGAGASTTINANVSVTLTGLQNPSEVRVFNAGTQTERSGTGNENVTAGSHSFSIPSGTAVDIVVLSLGYQNLRVLGYSTTSDASIPISQIVDRQYANP